MDSKLLIFPISAALACLSLGETRELLPATAPAPNLRPPGRLLLRHSSGVRCDDNAGYQGNNGRDYDRGNANGQYGQYGSSQQNPAFQNGFRDGMNDGRNDYQSRRSSSPTNTSNYRNATAGYNRSWGSQDQYRDMYRQGYMRGYQRGYNAPGGQDSYEPR